MIILKTKQDLSSDTARKAMAKYLSCIVDGNDDKQLPYMPNEGDTTFWTVDSGNDWKVCFFPDDPHVFGIKYRYQCEGLPYEQKLADWLGVRAGVTRP
jgi:hypothetical protein